MKKQMQPWLVRVIQYGSSFAVAAGIMWLYLSTHGLGDELSVSEKLRLWCDACTIPGLLYLMFGALVWASGLGALDGLSYALGNLFRSLIPGARARAQKEYYEYVQERREKRLQITKYAFLFISGLILLAAAVILLILFYQYNA